MVHQMYRSRIRKMKRSKSSNPILVSRSSQTLVKQRSFIQNEKDNRSSQGDTPDLKLEQLYKEAKESFENGEYENALIKFSLGAKIDPSNMDFILGVKKSKNSIMNDFTNSKDLLKELHDEISCYPKTKNVKEEIPLFPQEGKASLSKLKETESENDITIMTDVKSEAMKAAVTKTRGKKLEPTYNLTINDGSCYKTITATAQDVKEYLKDKDYFKMKDQTKKDWKKLRSEFNKKIAEKEAAQRYAKEAKFLAERSNIRQHCEEQVGLIGRHYQNDKMTDVIRFSENFIKYLNKKTDKMLPRKWIYIATAFNYLARANAEQGDFEKSKAFGEKLYRIAITSNKPELIAQSYILSGKIYVKFEKYKEAAFVWEKLIPLLTDDEKKAWLFHEIGRCYFELGKYDTSFKHGTESAHWANKCSSSTWVCAANVLLGQIEMKRNNYDKALKKFTEAKKHAEISDDDQTLNYINSVQEILHVVLSRNRNKSTDGNENTGSVNGNVPLAEEEK